MSQEPEEEFAVLINKVMAKGIQDGADPDVMARICLNTARELYDHYGAGEDHMNYLTYVTDAQFEQDVSIEEARDMMWRPKTDAAVREVPFDWRARVEIAVERHFDRFDRWPLSRSGLTRRVDKSLRHAEELDEETTHCHGLRATAATHHAGRGVSTLTLQALMGWAQASTARVYVRASPDNTQRELHQANSR